MVVYDKRGRRDKKSLNKVLTFFSLYLFVSRRIGLKEEGEKKWLYLYLVSFDCADACMNGHTNNLLAPLALSLALPLTQSAEKLSRAQWKRERA